MRLNWDNAGERLFETGVRNGVLYPFGENKYGKGVAWNGLTAVTESPSGAEATALYADDMKYLNLMSAEEFGATVEAYTYPKEFEACDGSAEVSEGVTIGQQERKTFGMSYRTVVGNDLEGNEHGYKLHLIYGALAAPSERAYSTINDSPEAITFSWEVSTTPVNVPGRKAASLLTIDSTKCDKAKLKQLEDILYGVAADEFSASATYKVGDYCTYESKTYKCKTAIQTAGAWDPSKWDVVEDVDARLPLPAEVIELFGPKANG